MLKHLFVSLVVLLWNNAYSLNLGSYPNEALSRRSFMGATAASFIAAGNSLIPLAAHASYPSVTVAQFQTILQDSASSIKIVEFSGPKSETALVTLVDGTAFRISDLFESSTDPRSPLKLVATCRSYGVPTQFTSLQNVVAQLSETGGKRRKVYMNKRVQEAMEKEKEKKERMAQDEAERIMLEEQQIK